MADYLDNAYTTDRRRLLAEQLLQESNQQPTSMFQAIAGGLRGLAGNAAMGKVQDEYAGRQKAMNEALAQVLQEPDRAKAMQLLAQQPDLVGQFGPTAVMDLLKQKPQARMMTPQQEIDMFGRDVPGNFAMGENGIPQQIAGTAPPEVKPHDYTNDPFMPNPNGGDPIPNKPYQDYQRRMKETTSAQPSLQPYTGSDGKMYSFNNRTGSYSEAKGLAAGVTATRPSASAAGPMTPEAVDEAAATWQMTGTPPTGYGRSPKNLVIIANRKAEMDLAAGDSTGAAVAKQVANKASQKALTDITQRYVMLEANARNAENNFQTIERLSSKVDRTGSPLVNHIAQAFQTRIVQNPDLAALKNAVSEGATEYAKVVTGQTTGQAVTDTANSQMQKLISTADSPQAFASELATMREFIANRKSGFSQERQSLLNSMQPSGLPAQGAAGPKILRFDAQGNPVQ